MAPKLPPKKDVCVALLEKASVFLHLDPRKDQVVVPPWFRQQPQLVLQVGLNMAVPIPDLNVDDECVSCTLSFNRSPFFCWVPWTAIFALVGEDGRGMVWPDDIPPEVAAQAQKVAAKQKPTDGKSAPRRGHLRAVDQERAAATASDSASDHDSLATAQSKDAPSEPLTVPATLEDPGDREPESEAPLVAGAETEPPPRMRDEEREDEEPRPSGRKLPPYLRVVK
jgi:hypothetical protein